jgi:hypothetical protein
VGLDQREGRGERAARLRHESLSESSSARQVKSIRAARRGFWAAHETPISVSLAFFAPPFFIVPSLRTDTALVEAFDFNAVSRPFSAVLLRPHKYNRLPLQDRVSSEKRASREDLEAQVGRGQQRHEEFPGGGMP